MDILFLLLTFSFISLPLGQLTRVELQNGVAFNLFDLSVLLLAVCFVLFRVLRKKVVSIPHLGGAICLFWFVGFVSLILNSFRLSLLETAISALFGVRWLLFAFVYFYIVQLDTKQKKKIVTMMLISGAVTVGIGLLQFFLYPDLRNLSYAGWDEHYLRLFGSFLDPNFMGSFAVLYFIFLSTVFFQIWRKSHFFSAKTIAFSLVLLATFVTIFLTYSRSALIMLVVAVLVFLFQLGKKKIALGCVLALTLLGVLLSSNRSEGTNLFRISSTLARVSSAEEGLSVFSKSPLYGIGFNAYKYVTQGESDLTYSKKPDHGESGTDNSFIFVLATTGILGLFVYIYLLHKIYSYQSKESSPLLLRRTTLVAIVVNAFFVNSLFYPVILFWLWSVAGISENK